MRRTLTITALTATTMLAAPAAAQDSTAERPTLTIYTYESFTAEWGPGPLIEAAFEAQCECDLEWVSVADGVALLNRLRLEGARSRADVVLGLDDALVAEAEATGLFAPHGLDLEWNVPGGFASDVFVPYDYGHFAVVYDSEAIEPLASLRALVDGEGEGKIVVQDPRSSTPGLGLLRWVRAVYGDEAPQAWERLSDRILTVTPGWSEAYGLFTAGEAPMVLSYATSPAYHMEAEGTDRYRAMRFEEGHPVQVEVSGMLAATDKPALAREFLAFTLQPGFQDAIPAGNWMMPAGETAQPLPGAFSRLIEPDTLPTDTDEVAKNRRAWTDEWLAAMGR